MINVDLQLLAAQAFLGRLPVDRMVRVAQCLIDGGIQSTSLMELYLLTAVEQENADNLFLCGLSEAGVSVPDTHAAICLVAKDIAGKIISKELTPIEGATQIWQTTLSAPCEDFPDLHSFIYAASEWYGRSEHQAIFTRGIIEAAQELVQ